MADKSQAAQLIELRVAVQGMLDRLAWLEQALTDYRRKCDARAERAERLAREQRGANK